MTIYSRFGCEIEIVRTACIADVRHLDGRAPDTFDRESVSRGAYVVAKRVEDDEESLQNICYLRADDGMREIADAIEIADGKAAQS